MRQTLFENETAYKTNKGRPVCPECGGPIFRTGVCRCEARRQRERINAIVQARELLATGRKESQ